MPTIRGRSGVLRVGKRFETFREDLLLKRQDTILSRRKVQLKLFPGQTRTEASATKSVTETTFPV